MFTMNHNEAVSKFLALWNKVGLQAIAPLSADDEIFKTLGKYAYHNVGHALFVAERALELQGEECFRLDQDVAKVIVFAALFHDIYPYSPTYLTVERMREDTFRLWSYQEFTLAEFGIIDILLGASTLLFAMDNPGKPGPGFAAQCFRQADFEVLTFPEHVYDEYTAALEKEAKLFGRDDSTFLSARMDWILGCYMKVVESLPRHLAVKAVDNLQRELKILANRIRKENQ